MWCFTIQRTSKNFASELRRNVMASNGIAIIGRVPCRSTGYEVKGEILDYGDVIESCRLPGRELCYHSQLKGVYMSEPTVTHLERRKIEAGVLHEFLMLPVSISLPQIFLPECAVPLSLFVL